MPSLCGRFCPLSAILGDAAQNPQFSIPQIQLSLGCSHHFERHPPPFQPQLHYLVLEVKAQLTLAWDDKSTTHAMLGEDGHEDITMVHGTGPVPILAVTIRPQASYYLTSLSLNISKMGLIIESTSQNYHED